MRAHQDRTERVAHTSFEAFVRIPGLIESHQRIQILVGYGSTERAPCECADDSTRTRCLLRSRLGLTDKNLLAANGVAHGCDGQRSTDLQRMYGLDALLTSLERNRANALVAFRIAAM